MKYLTMCYTVLPSRSCSFPWHRQSGTESVCTDYVKQGQSGASLNEQTYERSKTELIHMHPPTRKICIAVYN